MKSPSVHRLLSILLLLHLGFISSKAQSPCGTDHVHQKHMESDSAYAAEFEKTLRNSIKYRSPVKKTDTLIYIPIVVHVIHEGESYGSGLNIHDSIIKAAVDAANDRFRGRIENGVDIGMEFRLASRDENGCATTGITRHEFSSVSAGATVDVAIKRNTGWSNTEYYNIWVIPKYAMFGNYSGYAYYPQSSPFELDGILIVNSYMTAGSTVLTHELGHAFNLFHTFEGGCTTSSCSSSGDYICDTGPHSQTDCSPNPNCSDTSYYYNSRKNYMSYCASPILFTAGQKDRMLACFGFTTRSLLLNSPALLPAPNNSASVDGVVNICENQLEINLHNRGFEALDSVTIGYKLANQASVEMFWYGNLNACSSEQIIISDSNLNNSDDSVLVYCSMPNGVTDSASSDDSLMLPVPLRPGIYSLGNDTCDFESIKDVLIELKRGICGPVEFQFPNGTHVLNDTISELVGNSVENTITFSGQTGNPDSVILKSNGTSEPVIVLSQVSHVIIKNLGFSCDSGVSSFLALRLEGSTNDIEVDGCVFQGKAGTTRFISDNRFANHSTSELHIHHCLFLDGSNSIYLSSRGSSFVSEGINISNNRFVNGSRAMEFYIVSGIEIRENEFEDHNNIVINFDNCSGNILVDRNFFHQGFINAVYVDECNASETKPIIISNNFMVSNEQINAFQCVYSSSVYIVHNSVYAYNLLHSYNVGTRLFRSNDVQILNNNISLKTGQCIVSDTLSDFMSNYNNYYIEYQDTNLLTSSYYAYPIKSPLFFDELQSSRGLDLNSLQIDPLFKSTSSPKICVANLNNTAFPLSYIVSDYYGFERDDQNPDIGAYEFSETAPDPIIQEPYFGCGNSTVMLNPQLVGYTHLWMNASEENNIIINSSQMVSVEINDTICGSIYEDSVFFIIYPTKTYELLAPNTACDSMIFSIKSSIHYESILWSNGDTASPMILKASGPIYYFITDSLGCVHHSDTVNGTVAQAPKVYLGNDTTIDLNANLILDAGSFQDATYIWSNGSNQQSIQLSGSLLGLGDHPHWVRVTDKNFCRGRDTILVTVSETGSLYPHQSMGIIGYPNPVQTHLYIDSREGIAMQSIRITDQRAELVYTQTGLIGTYKQIDLGYLLPGVYTVQILTESSVYYLSIIKI